MAIPDLAAGTLVLDRYRVISSLPWGHARRPAALARDLRLTQHVDLIFSPAPTGTLAGDLFMRRAEAMAALPHSAVPLLLDMGLHCGHGVVAYRHMDGQVLADTLDRDRVTWTVERALSSVGELAGALGRAHAAGIAHGSFGPCSVMVEQSGRLVILDLVWPYVSVALTRQDMAPEVQRGFAPSPRSDVYALGRLLQTLIGQAGSKTTPDLDAAIGDVAWRATMTVPSARFANGTALAQALEPLAAAAAVASDTPAVHSRRVVSAGSRVAMAPAPQAGGSLTAPVRRAAVPLALGLAVILAPFADIAMHEVLGHAPVGAFLLHRDGDSWRPQWQPHSRIWLWRPGPRTRMGTPWDWSPPPDQDGR